MIDLNWSFQRIPPEWIRVNDSPFDWKNVQTDHLLQQSLEKNGFLMPLIAQEIGVNRYVLVDGFKRMRALPLLEDQTRTLFPCLLIAANVSKREVALWRLETQVAQHVFKGVEICRILKALAEEGMEESQLMEQVLPQLGLKPSQKITRDLLNLAKILDLDESSCIGNYSAQDLLHLLKFSKTEIPTLVHHLKNLELGGNKWKTLLQLIREVSRMRGWSLEHIMESPELAHTFNDRQIQLPVRYRLLKQRLESWRFPELTASRQEFAQCLRQLQIPSRANIQYDSCFEKDDIVLKLQTGSYEELCGQLDMLRSSLSQRDEWKKLFHLIQGL